MITIYSACGTGESSSQNASVTKAPNVTVDSNWGGFSWQVANGVDQTNFTPVAISYPAKGFQAGSAVTYLNSVAAGVSAGQAMINDTTGQFMLVGYDQGAQVISMILQSLQSGGALASQMHRFVAGVTFGNPMRAHGSSWPGDPTGPTGQGINASATSGLLTSTPSTWWDMTNTYDFVGNTPTGTEGGFINDIWNAAGNVTMVSVPQMITAFLAVIQGNSDPLGNIIAALLSSPLTTGAALTAAIGFMVNASSDTNTLGHTCFGTAEIASSGLTFVQTAINYLDSFVSA